MPAAFARLLLLYTGLLASLGWACPSPAGQLSNGQTFFEAPPRLLDYASTYTSVSANAAKYYFTFNLPATAGEPLAQVVFQQQPNPDQIQFQADQTIAFLGSQDHRGTPLTVQSATWDANSSQVRVTLNPPVPPGNLFSIRLQPVQNPDIASTYQFRVFAYPSGSQGQAMDLGVARFQFYRYYD